MGLALKEQKVDLRSTKDKTEEKALNLLAHSTKTENKGIASKMKKHFHESVEGWNTARQP